MAMIKHKDGIYEIENFLTDKELSTLLESIKEDYFVEHHHGTVVQDLNENALSLVPTISERMMFYFENADSHTKITNIRRLKTNEFMHSHKDNDSIYVKKKIIFGIVIYLNDDFVGGELKYTDINFYIKPKSTNMVIHDSQINHEVLPIKSGNRYCITSFIYGDDNTKIKSDFI